MIQNVNPQQMYAPPNMMPVMQNYAPQLPVPCVAPCQLPQMGAATVYNSIPYNPVYGNCCQPQQQRAYSPKISTVSIEMNGLQPPQVPGLNDFQQPQMPVYPGMTQLYQSQPAYNPYPVMPQAIPQGFQPQPQPVYPGMSQMCQPQPAVPYSPYQVMPQTIPQDMQPQPQPVYPPAPQYIQPQPLPAPEPTTQNIQPQPAAEQAQAPVNPQQDQEAVRPLIDALSVICPKQGAPEATMEQQEKAIQTIAQFARVAEAAGQLVGTNPNNADAKQTKEKVDALVKPNLIKEETFLGLADIATKDTSKLTGEDKKKADQNRTISMWTLAMLQKLFKQEMNIEAKKINIPPISMNEVPGIVQIADIVKKDANPEVREAGIAALINLADPQDKKDAETMRAILGEAQKDSDANVKTAASEAIKMYPEQASK